jgi:hypothetical protein
MSALTWTPHPVLAIPTQAQCLANGEQWTFDLFTKRERLIALEREDPFRHGFELETWKEGRELIEELNLFIILGGNGAAKTWFMAKDGVRNAIEGKDRMILFLHESEPSSIRIHQKAVYHFLPRELRPTDDNKVKRGVVQKIKYSVATGFSDNNFVLPNGSQVVFGSYKQDISDYEGDGWFRVYADENLPLAWLRTLLYRLPRRGGKLIWGFTPIRGITPAIKHIATGAATLKSERAELLPETHRVKEGQDWPAGHMPTLQRCVQPKTVIAYWPTKKNPWSGYEAFRELLSTKTTEEIERRAYGFARNTATTLFPKFGAVHIIEPDQIPQDGTDYHVLDPALARNFFMLWCRVDRDERRFIADEWPDFETYGEWAVESEQPNRFNGDPGPAQDRLGWGTTEYKRLILTREGAVWNAERGEWDFTAWREPERRFIDPRAGAAEQLADEEGDSSIIFRFSEENVDREGRLAGPEMALEPAMGKDEREGIEAITDLMDYNPAQPVTRYTNEPRLYISSRCVNLIWAIQNYTKRQGAVRDEACKDPIDTLRYLSTEDLPYIPRGHTSQTAPRGYTRPGNSTQKRSARIRTYPNK